MDKELRQKLVKQARENGEKHGKTAELDFGAGAEWMYQQHQNISCNSNYQKFERLLHNAIGLLMNHEQVDDLGWKKDYEKLILSYQEQYPSASTNSKSMPCCPKCKTDYDVGVFHVCENCGHRWS